MSLIKKADVKNHLTARHRTEIHVARPERQSGATGFPHEEPANKDPQVNDSVENSLNVPTLSDPEPAPIVTPENVKA
jgi:hypothetical protein